MFFIVLLYIRRSQNAKERNNAAKRRLPTRFSSARTPAFPAAVADPERLRTTGPAQNAPPAPADKSEQQKAAYAALADLLQDDKARAELINHLKQAADDTPTAAPATPEESTPATLSDSLNALAQEGLGTFNQKLGALQS